MGRACKSQGVTASCLGEVEGDGSVDRGSAADQQASLAELIGPKLPTPLACLEKGLIQCVLARPVDLHRPGKRPRLRTA